MTKSIVCGDGNFLLHRAYHAAAHHVADPTRKIPMMIAGHFMGFVLRFNVRHGAICFDGPNNFRKTIYEGYKIERKGNDGVYSCLQPTIDLLKLLGIPVYQISNLEADDQISALGFHVNEEGGKSYLITRDKDILQRVSKDSVVIFPETGNEKEVVWTPELVKKEKGLTPKEFLTFQVLIGDSIDSVPPILTESTARKAIAKFGTLNQILESDSKVGAYLRENIDDVKRNANLVKMDYRFFWPGWDDLKIGNSSVNDKEIEETYGKIPKTITAYRSVSSKKGMFQK